MNVTIGQLRFQTDIQITNSLQDQFTRLFPHHKIYLSLSGNAYIALLECGNEAMNTLWEM